MYSKLRFPPSFIKNEPKLHPIWQIGLDPQFFLQSVTARGKFCSQTSLPNVCEIVQDLNKSVPFFGPERGTVDEFMTLMLGIARTWVSQAEFAAIGNGFKLMHEPQPEVNPENIIEQYLRDKTQNGDGEETQLPEHAVSLWQPRRNRKKILKRKQQNDGVADIPEEDEPGGNVGNENMEVDLDHQFPFLAPEDVGDTETPWPPLSQCTFASITLTEEDNSSLINFRPNDSDSQELPGMTLEEFDGLGEVPFPWFIRNEDDELVLSIRGASSRRPSNFGDDVSEFSGILNKSCPEIPPPKSPEAGRRIIVGLHEESNDPPIGVNQNRSNGSVERPEDMTVTSHLTNEISSAHSVGPVDVSLATQVQRPRRRARPKTDEKIYMEFNKRFDYKSKGSKSLFRPDYFMDQDEKWNLIMKKLRFQKTGDMHRGIQRQPHSQKLAAFVRDNLERQTVFEETYSHLHEMDEPEKGRDPESQHQIDERNIQHIPEVEPVLEPGEVPGSSMDSQGDFSSVQEIVEEIPTVIYPSTPDKNLNSVSTDLPHAPMGSNDETVQVSSENSYQEPTQGSESETEVTSSLNNNKRGKQPKPNRSKTKRCPFVQFFPELEATLIVQKEVSPSPSAYYANGNGKDIEEVSERQLRPTEVFGNPPLIEDPTENGSTSCSPHADPFASTRLNEFEDRFLQQQNEYLFHEAFPLATTSRNVAAKAFFNMLNLVKEKKIHAEQDACDTHKEETFNPIKITVLRDETNLPKE